MINRERPQIVPAALALFGVVEVMPLSVRGYAFGFRAMEETR